MSTKGKLAFKEPTPESREGVQGEARRKEGAGEV